MSLTKRSKRETLPTPVAIADQDVRMVKRKDWRYGIRSYSSDVLLYERTRLQLSGDKGKLLSGGDGGLGFLAIGGLGVGGGGDETALAAAEPSPAASRMATARTEQGQFLATMATNIIYELAATGKDNEDR